jgi:hypothetical protein
MILLAAAAVLLLTSYLLGTLFSPNKAVSMRPKKLLPDIEYGDIKGVDFSNADYVLERKGKTGEWEVLIDGEAFPADEVQVQSFIETIARLSYYSIAATGNANWENFGVDAQQGTAVSLFTETQKQPGVTLVMGNAVQGSEHQYARISESENTYVVEDISAYLGHSSGYWSDLAIFPESLSVQDIIAIEYQEKRLERSEGSQGQVQWILTDGNEEVIDKTKTVDRFIRSFIELSGEEFASALERRNSGITSPTAVIAIETAAGNSYELRIGSGNSQDRVFVRPAHKAYTYLVSEWRINTVLNPLQELLR